MGSHVITVTASDVDEEAHAIEYSLNPANEWFDIGRYTGSVHLKRELDYEDVQQHELRVQVCVSHYVGTKQIVGYRHTMARTCPT